MPCWEVNLMNVEFKAANRDRLVKAIEEDGFQYTELSGVIEMRLGRNSSIIFDLPNEKATLVNTTDTDPLNKIKRAYSRLTIEEVAKKKRWALRKQGKNKFQMVR